MKLKRETPASSSAAAAPETPAVPTVTEEPTVLPVARPLPIPQIPFVAHEKMADKVCIVGFAPGKEEAPYGDKSYEIWGMNELYTAPEVKRIDVLFEIHDETTWDSKDRNPKHREWLQKATIPIYMVAAYPEFPRSIAYPRQAVKAIPGFEYVNNSVAWMIGLAVLMGYPEIRLYGVNMQTQSEYGTQRPSCEYHIGLARGRGHKVLIPHSSDLLKSPGDYGFESSAVAGFAGRLRHMAQDAHQRAMQSNAQSEALRDQANQQAGAAGAINNILSGFLSIHGSGEPKPEPAK